MNVQSAIDMLQRFNSPNAEVVDEYDFPLVGATISNEGKVELEFEIPDEERLDEEEYDEGQHIDEEDEPENADTRRASSEENDPEGYRGEGDYREE